MIKHQNNQMLYIYIYIYICTIRHDPAQIQPRFPTPSNETKNKRKHWHLVPFSLSSLLTSPLAPMAAPPQVSPLCHPPKPARTRTRTHSSPRSQHDNSPPPDKSLQRSTPSGPRFVPYHTQKHHVTRGRYITSNDPRGYL